jgi:murein L,D-transpeptidase YcbB/YkuD
MKRASITRALISILIVLGPVGDIAAESGVQTLWVQHGRLTQSATEVLNALRHVESFGLDPRDFTDSLAAIDSQVGKPADAAQLDGLMSTAALRLIEQLHYGRVDPQAAGYQLHHRRAPLDNPGALRSVATSAHPLDVLATFEPQGAQYRALKQVLAQYRLIRTDLTSLPVPERSPVRAGDTYAGAEKLRWLLAELGDGRAPRENGAVESTYDMDQAAAVAHFQRRHGLEADGVIGPRTFVALTVPMARRIRQIELTLERWRWLPDIRPPAVIVNVPQFMLYALPERADRSADTGALKIPVIVGQSAQQTPIFDSAIESIIFRPYWNVPRSILRKELLPLISRDFGYLARHDMEIVHGDGDDARVLPANAASVAELRAGGARLRQLPGPTNALGLIKFVLPNEFSVYLHSTPESQLFSRDRRAFSHGCIRVSDARALAAYLLKDTPGDWNADAIEAATCADKTFTVRLARPVPVFILYGTAVIDADGAALFFDDVYGYDRRLEALLTGSH